MWLCWLEAAEAVEAELRETTPRFVLVAAAVGLARFLSGSSRPMNTLPRARSLWERAALPVPQLPLQTADLAAMGALASFG